MEDGEDWDAKDIGRSFANNPDVQPQYKLFIGELEMLKPAFGDGVRVITSAMRNLRRLLKTMVTVFAKARPNTFIPPTLSVQWRYLCNKHLLGSALKPCYKSALQMTPAEKLDKEELAFSYIQIRKCIGGQVNKYNDQISQDRLLQASTNAKKSKKESGYHSDECYINGDDNCYKYGDSDDEKIADDDSDEEEDLEEERRALSQSSSPSVVSPEVNASTPLPPPSTSDVQLSEEGDGKGGEEEEDVEQDETSMEIYFTSTAKADGWEDESHVETDEYAEEMSEGKISSSMSDSSIRSPQSPISEIVVSPVVIASSPLPPQSASEMQLSEGDDDEKEEGKDVSPSPSTEEVVESMVSLFFSADGEKGDTTSVRIEFGDGYLEGQSEEEVGEGKILLPMHALLINLSLPSPISGGGGRGGGEGIEEEGEYSSPGPKRKIQVISPSSTTKEVAATIPGLRRRLIRTASNSSDQAFFSPTTPNPSAKVTPKKVRKAPKKKRGSSSAKLVDHSVDNFSFSFLQIKEAIEHFIKFGFVKLHPNQAFKYHATDLVQRLVDEAKALDTTLDEMLRIHVDEPMSTALGDKLRSMKHEKNYPIGEDPHTKFFDIMRELNLHFVSGNQSALRMLTSNLQEADKPLKVFHHPTEVLDLMTKPKGKSQNAHIDAFLDEVQ